MSTESSPAPSVGSAVDEDEAYEPSPTGDILLPADTPSPFKKAADEEDEYKAPTIMAPAPTKPPVPFTSSTLDVCVSLVDRVDAGYLDDVKTLPFKQWQVALRGMEVQLLAGILLYAAAQLTSLIDQLSHSNRPDIAAALASMPGLQIGIPLVELRWRSVTGDMILRMSPMVIRSCILQACTAINELRAKMARLENVLIRPARAKEGGVDYIVSVSELFDSAQMARMEDVGGFGPQDTPMLHASDTLKQDVDELNAEGNAACDGVVSDRAMAKVPRCTLTDCYGRLPGE